MRSFVCKECKEEMYLDMYEEPTDYCHDCSHFIIERLEGMLDKARLFLGTEQLSVQGAEEKEKLLEKINKYFEKLKDENN